MTVSATDLQERRPRDRKQQIINAATDLFRARGYHNVSLAEVGATVGITAAAVYRHFRNKEDLLFEVVSAAMGGLEESVRDAADLDGYLRAAGIAALQRRGLAALWQREARHLSEPRRALLRARLIAIATRLATLLGAGRADLANDDAQLLAWALLAVSSSFSVHRGRVPQREFLQAHLDMTSAVAGCRLTRRDSEDTGACAPSGPPAGLDLPRRERLLAEAIRLFDRCGYQSITMSDIGSAAGITASTVYKHFPSKHDVLVSALARGNEQLRAGMMHALTASDGRTDALDRLLRAQIDFALEHSHLIGILVSERTELPTAQRDGTHRAQREYAEVWLNLLATVRPELPPQTAKMLVDTVFAVVNALVRIGSLARRNDLRDRLVQVTSALLTFATHPLLAVDPAGYATSVASGRTQGSGSSLQADL